MTKRLWWFVRSISILLAAICSSQAHAQIAHLQQASNADVTGKTYTSFTATFSSPLASGNAILLGITFGNTNPTITASDTQGNSYTQAVKTYDSSHRQGCLAAGCRLRDDR